MRFFYRSLLPTLAIEAHLLFGERQKTTRYREREVLFLSVRVFAFLSFGRAGRVFRLLSRWRLFLFPEKWNIRWLWDFNCSLLFRALRALPPPPRVKSTATTVKKNAKESFSPCSFFFSLSLSLKARGRAPCVPPFERERVCSFFVLWIFDFWVGTFSKIQKIFSVKCLLFAFYSLLRPRPSKSCGLPFREGAIQKKRLGVQKQPKTEKKRGKRRNPSACFFCLVNTHYY